MQRYLTLIAFMFLTSSAFAEHVVATSSHTVIAKHLVYTLDGLSFAAQDDAYDAYSYLDAAKLKYLASKADKLASQIQVKILHKYLSKTELADAFKKLAHDIKNYENALKKVKYPSRSLKAKAAVVDVLLEELAEASIGRGRVTEVCRGRCSR